LVFGHSYGNINPTVKIPRLRQLQFVVPHKRKVESIALYTTDIFMIEAVFQKGITAFPGRGRGRGKGRGCYINNIFTPAHQMRPIFGQNNGYSNSEITDAILKYSGNCFM
jgi:hypothetical protein